MSTVICGVDPITGEDSGVRCDRPLCQRCMHAPALTLPAPTACAHGYPSPASCLACMEDDGLGAEPIAPPSTERASRVFVARHPGRCHGCEFPISVGDRIVYMTDDTTRHEDCA